MARIKPFKGILYNASKTDIRKTVAPPYDVISPAMQGDFYKSDKQNIIRLILGRETPHDAPRDNKYTRAGQYLNKWLADKMLLKDKKSSIYIYEQKYLHKGKKIKRIGFIALMKIEDPAKSGVLPHEYTLAKPKKDRLKLIASTKANLSPIFSLFEDKKNAVNKVLRHHTKKNAPVFSFETEGVNHALWRMTDGAPIKKIVNEMQDKKIFIADGHHRYEVAFFYRNAMRGKSTFRPAMGYVMMYFSNLSERGSLTILSTHRAVRNVNDPGHKKTKKLLQEYFVVEALREKSLLFELMEKEEKSRHALGMYAGQNVFYFLRLKRGLSLDKLINSTKTRDLKRLDVTILHELIINQILGIKSVESSIKYVRSEDDAIELVDGGGYEAAFFLKPTDINDMRKIALKGVMMPQKSTYFYPKLLTGLVINKF
ncbi:MAG: DUF1015 domain-containing protein [Candidatus Omnitrophica bacterium]|nr:DUF1015 domain-containing protein [Candidatus Omnitrophota bacterium]